MNPKFETSVPQRKADLRREARALALQQLRDKLLLPLFGLLLLVGLLAAAWVVSRDQRTGPAGAALTPEELASLKSEVDERERNFATLVPQNPKTPIIELTDL